MKFNIGDKVRIKANCYGDVFMGRVATIMAGPVDEYDNTYMAATDTSMQEHEFSRATLDFHACFMGYELELVE